MKKTLKIDLEFELLANLIANIDAIDNIQNRFKRMSVAELREYGDELNMLDCECEKMKNNVCILKQKYKDADI